MSTSTHFGWSQHGTLWWPVRSCWLQAISMWTTVPWKGGRSVHSTQAKPQKSERQKKNLFFHIVKATLNPENISKLFVGLFKKMLVVLACNVANQVDIKLKSNIILLQMYVFLLFYCCLYRIMIMFTRVYLRSFAQCLDGPFPIHHREWWQRSLCR